MVLDIQSNLEIGDYGEQWYTLSVTALGDSICVETAGSQWVDSVDGGEIRKATPHADTLPWELFKECWCKIEGRSEFINFLVSGGHCLAPRDLISMWWPEFFVPTKCFRYCEEVPFIASDFLPPGAETRHPNKLIRKRVLARDEYRCRICGHSPEDHPAIKLEIHHVVEQAIGGLTVENNLITLCKNCHENATPPDPWLRSDLFDKIVVAASRYHRRSHAQGVSDYREWVVSSLIGRQGASTVDELAIDYLSDEDVDLWRRNAKWHYAYTRIAANSLVRYFPCLEWRRYLPEELKRR
jgi:HNH endonuclease